MLLSQVKSQRGVEITRGDQDVEFLGMQVALDGVAPRGIADLHGLAEDINGNRLPGGSVQLLLQDPLQMHRGRFAAEDLVFGQAAQGLLEAGDLLPAAARLFLPAVFLQEQPLHGLLPA